VDIGSLGDQEVKKFVEVLSTIDNAFVVATIDIR